MPGSRRTFGPPRFLLLEKSADLPRIGTAAARGEIPVVFGIAEICLGRRRTLALAYVAPLAGTLCARVGIAVGPSGFLGCPARTPTS